MFCANQWNSFYAHVSKENFFSVLDRSHDKESAGDEISKFKDTAEIEVVAIKFAQPQATF